MGWISYLRAGSAQRHGRRALHSIEQVAAAVEALGQVVDAQTSEGPERLLDFERLLPTPRDLLDGAPCDAPGQPVALPGWYQWRLERWGVKWNASHARRRGYGRTGRVRCRFFTPWGAPGPFLDHVAQFAPEISMQLTYEVELLGHGRAAWREGRQVDYEVHTAYGRTART